MGSTIHVLLLNDALPHVQAMCTEEVDNSMIDTGSCSKRGVLDFCPRNSVSASQSWMQECVGVLTAGTAKGTQSFHVGSVWQLSLDRAAGNSFRQNEAVPCHILP